MNGTFGRHRIYFASGILFVCLILLPIIFTQREDIVNLTLLVLFFISIAQSWNLLGGYAGQVNLGYAAFFGLGSLVTRQLWLSFQVAYPLALLAGTATSTLFALVIGIPTLRFKGPYFVFGTFALGEILRIIVTNLFPKLSFLSGDRVSNYNIASRYFFSLALAVFVTAVVHFVSRSRLGMAMKAVREDEVAAEATGINTLKPKLAAFTMSALLAGLCGGFFAFYHISYYHFYPFSPSWTFDAMFITYVGGVGTIVGPALGAIFFVFLREQLALRIAIGEIHLIIFGTLFILVVLILRRGLFEPIEKLFRPFAR